MDDPDVLQVSNLMQGTNPSDGSVYLGDTAFVAHDVPTVQVHVVDVDLGPGASAPKLAVAIHLAQGAGGRLTLQTRYDVETEKDHLGPALDQIRPLWTA